MLGCIMGSKTSDWTYYLLQVNKACDNIVSLLTFMCDILSSACDILNLTSRFLGNRNGVLGQKGWRTLEYVNKSLLSLC